MADAAREAGLAAVLEAGLTDALEAGLADAFDAGLAAAALEVGLAEAALEAGLAYRGFFSIVAAVGHKTTNPLGGGRFIAFLFSYSSSSAVGFVGLFALLGGFGLLGLVFILIFLFLVRFFDSGLGRFLGYGLCFRQILDPGGATGLAAVSFGSSSCCCCLSGHICGEDEMKSTDGE